MQNIIFNQSKFNPLFLGNCMLWLSANRNRLDLNSVRDWSGKNNHGTYNGGGGLPLINQGFTFDGSDDFLNIAHNSIFDFEYNNSFSIFCWVKSTDSSGDGFLVAKEENTNPNRGYYLFIDNGGGVGHPGGGIPFVSLQNATNIIDRHGSTNIRDGLWHYVGFTYSGSGIASGIIIYVDNIRETMVTLTDNLGGNTIRNTVALTVASRDTGGVPLTASIDEVLIFNRVLTDLEISYLYNKDKRRFKG